MLNLKDTRMRSRRMRTVRSSGRRVGWGGISQHALGRGCIEACTLQVEDVIARPTGNSSNLLKKSSLFWFAFCSIFFSFHLSTAIPSAAFYSFLLIFLFLSTFYYVFLSHLSFTLSTITIRTTVRSLCVLIIVLTISVNGIYNGFPSHSRSDCTKSAATISPTAVLSIPEKALAEKFILIHFFIFVWDVSVYLFDIVGPEKKRICSWL